LRARMNKASCGGPLSQICNALSNRDDPVYHWLCLCFQTRNAMV
jgi:hypothetical protein